MASSEPEPVNRECYAEKFRSSRNTIIAALEHRAGCFSRLTDCIDACTPIVDLAKQECGDTLDDCSTEALHQLEETLQKQLTLSLIAFGRSNTGKSTLLNQILSQWPDEKSVGAGLFPMAEHTCTARITTLSYGPAKTVCLADPRNPDEIRDKRTFETPSDIRKLIALEGDKRQNESVRQIVKIEMPSNLLRHQMQLVDSPGMGENIEMNEAVRSFLGECVHSGIIIYVLDGKEGYKPDPDTGNIRFLMEQPGHIQNLIAANRIDFDAKAFCVDSGDSDVDADDPESVHECLMRRNIHFQSKCDQHSQARLKSVEEALHKYHPGCIPSATDKGNGTILVGLSPRSAREFISGNWKFPHPPYLDSFLQFEARVSALIHVNARHHLSGAIKALQENMLQAELSVIANKLILSIKAAAAQEPIAAIRRALPMIDSVYSQICTALKSLASHESVLNFDGADNELAKLRDRFVLDGVKSEIRIDENPVMRTAEAQLINSLMKAHGKTREAMAGIRLLCNFKDAVVSQLSSWLKSEYRKAFVKAMFGIAFGDALERQSGLKEGDFRNLMSEVKTSVQALEPNDDAFYELCISKLTESMRRALPSLVGDNRFSLVVGCQSPNWRSLLLNYFLKGADLEGQVESVISCYCEQLEAKKKKIEGRLSGLLELLEAGQETGRKEVLKQLRKKLVVMRFYLIGLTTELEWTADYTLDACKPIFEFHLGKPDGQQMSQRMEQKLAPQGGQQPLVLRYRLLELGTDKLKQFAVSAMRLSNKLPDPVQLHWLCRADSYRSFTQDGATCQVLLAFEGIRCSLSDLTPREIPEAVQLAWLRSLLKLFADTLGAKYFPLDYRPSNVMISLPKLPPQLHHSEPLAASSAPCDLSGTVALPDPTHLLVTDPSQPANSASLAACIATLFGYFGPAPGADVSAGWDEHYFTQLRSASSDPAKFASFLPSCLGNRPERLVSLVCDCASACLSKKSDQVKEQIKALDEAME